MTRAVISAGVALALLAALLVLGPFASEHSTPGGLHVVAASSGPPRLEDGQGRSVLLRGVAVTSLIEYAPGYAENPPVSAADLHEIAALGFDFIRLPVSWSAIEPRPGVTDIHYLGRVATIVAAAHRVGLRVLIDMHLDRYNRGLAPHDEADGAPTWATLVPSSCPSQPGPADCARAAWNGFWQDRRVGGLSLQEHYIGALVALSRRVRGAANLAGLELMNNPSSGGAPSPAFESTQLWPFYRRAITALRRAGEGRPLWIDRAASSETTDTLPAGLPARVSRDRNLVLAPHDYSAVFSPPTWPAGGAARLTAWYADAVRQATQLRMALVIGEWGMQAGGPWDGLLGAKLARQDAAGVGSAFWMWKQRPGFYNWPVVNLDGSLRSETARAQMLSRPHPDAVPGRLGAVGFDGSRLTVRLAGPGGTAVLWSGTQILSGGPSGLRAPLTHASIDGRAVSASRTAVRFASHAVAMLGYDVRVSVPSGRHTLVLR